MEQAQAEQLGSKMRQAYADIEHEPAAPAPKRASRRLRKSGFAKPARAPSAGASLLQQHPLAALLTAAGIGYILARL